MRDIRNSGMVVEDPLVTLETDKASMDVPASHAGRIVSVDVAVVLTFAELASYFRESGGPVLYATYAFGPLAGFITL